MAHVLPGIHARWLRLLVVATALALGVTLAAQSRWLCDDIFITFRYAGNIVAGHGVVYNVGERVEGYTHVLWLALIALWTWAGGAPETIVVVLGLLAYAGVIITCGVRSTTLPLAALVLALHPDFRIWATSGMETMAFTWVVLLAAFALVDRRYLAAGMALSVAVLLRPDALVFCGLALVWAAFERGRQRAFMVLPFVICALYMAWRLWYFGELLPNPYYSKSAGVSNWGQGGYYIASYFKVYWSSAVALIALPFIKRREVAIPLMFALGYLVLFVARVGGDFMFARFMIPIVPLLYVAAEAALQGRQSMAVAVATLIILLGHDARRDGDVSGAGEQHANLRSRGIMDEHWYYTRVIDGMNAIERQRELGLTLKRYLEHEHVSVLLRGQAALGYYAEFSEAIESSGLTDRFIARMPLGARGRPGHEKGATLDYLRQRHVDFVFQRTPYDSTSREMVFRVGEGVVWAEVITETGLAERLVRRFPQEIWIPG